MDSVDTITQLGRRINTRRGEVRWWSTWVNVFDVPGQQSVEQRVKDHHQQNELQIVLVILHRRHGHVVPLHADTLDLVERKVLGTKTERRRRQHRLDTTNQPTYQQHM